MNTEHLRYLIEISKTKSMLQASEKLFVSPQALSKAMTNLEAELGMPLLIRSNNGVTLTINGQWLVEITSNYLAAIEKRKYEYKKYLNNGTSLPSGDLSIIFNKNGIDTNRIYDFITLLLQQTPDLNIQISEAIQQELITKINHKEADIGFTYRIRYNGNYLDTFDNTIAFVPIQTGEFFLLANEKLTKTSLKSIFLKKAIQYPLCSYRLEENSINDSIFQILHADISCNNINNWGLFRSNIENGVYATLTTKFEQEQYPINYIENIPLIKIRDDIQIIFGYVRLADELEISANANYFTCNLEAYLAQKHP